MNLFPCAFENTDTDRKIISVILEASVVRDRFLISD